MDMHIEIQPSPSFARSRLADHLLRLADDSHRAGLRPEGVILTAFAYSVIEAGDGSSKGKITYETVPDPIIEHDAVWS